MFARSASPGPRPRPSERPRIGPWLLVFLAAFAVRALAAAWAARGPAPAPAWLEVSRHLAAGSGFALQTAQGVQPTAAVAPLAPWLASGWLRLFGPVPSALPFGLAQAALGALAAVIVGFAALAIFGGGTGRIAGWVVALDPLLAMSPPPLESLAALLAILATLATVAWVRAPRPGRALGVGMLWGAAALTYPPLLVPPALIALWAWVPLGLTVQPRDRVPQTLLLAAGVALVVGPWLVRNGAVVHAWVPVATQPAFDLRDAGALGGRAADFMVPPVPLALRIVAGLLVPFWGWGTARALIGARRWFQSPGVLVIATLVVAALLTGDTVGARIAAEPLIVLFAAVGLDDARRRMRASARGLRVIPGRG